MPITYANIDTKVVGSIKIDLRFDKNQISDPEGFNQLLSEVNSGTGNTGDLYPIPIQFPPKVTADNKSASWGSYEQAGKTANMMLYTQYKQYTGSKDRQLGFELTYIVDGSNWKQSKIRAICHYIKAPLYMNTLATVGEKNLKPPMLQITNLYGAVESVSTWALETVDIKYSDKIINDNGIFGPIRTDISIKCKEMSAAGDEKIMKEVANVYAGVIDGIQKKTSAKWY